jgi:hypothetical protein
MPNNELKHTFKTVYEISLHGKVHLPHYAKQEFLGLKVGIS